jgi:glycosyltransferase involved in cell wall biosynthesis
MRDKKVLFIISHSVVSGPSQRYRIGLFLPLLEKNNIKYRIRSFYDEESGKILYGKGNLLRKIGIVAKGFLKRGYTTLFEAWKYDFLFIQRSALPAGPPLFEWIFARVLRKKIIYDFDDAIWVSDPTEKNKLLTWLKSAWKVKYICSWSYKVVGGNDYLCEYASKYNSSVIKIPTCVDTENHHNRLKRKAGDDKIIVGWTGSHSTLKYLDILVPVINELQEEFNFSFVVICNKPPIWNVKHWQFIKWNGATEVNDLLLLDIGIMPLTDDVWSEGKCGFKLVQYLSLGIPAVASPVGVNKQIIQNGVEGFLCRNADEWMSALSKLLSDALLRQQMGKAGRAKIEMNYSIKSQEQTFLALFS